MKRNGWYLSLLLVSTLLAFAGNGSGEEYSQLWGENGERWTPDSRLPDFSYAGYQCGEKDIPTFDIQANIKDFGAVGDGKHDDSQAFLDAIEQVDKGTILVPNGKYVLTEIIEIRKPNLVLRGESRDGVILYFPTPLNEIRPNWGATTGGRKTSNYSWSGGFFWMKGSYNSTRLAKVTTPAQRGDHWISINSNSRLQENQWIEVRVDDTKDNTLAHHLYTGQPGDTSKLNGRTHASLVTRISSIKEERIEIERPLRFDLEMEWNPRILRFRPNVTNVGIENLTFEYPVTPYDGHFTELGFNPIAMSDVVHCWVRNIMIKHADSGIFISGKFCTIEEIEYESDRPADSRGDTGHHGIYISDDDNLFTNFNFKTTFIHDLTVSHCSGNVISNGKGNDLCFDHHKRAPYANLYTNIDTGAGTHVWRCGGGAALGKHCAGYGTFWNIRADRSIAYPGGFGPLSMNLVAVQNDRPSRTDPDGLWFETIKPDKIIPKNIHEAQRSKRLYGNGLDIDDAEKY